MKKKAEKWMCMLLSAVMCFGSPCMTAFAEEAEEAAQATAEAVKEAAEAAGEAVKEAADKA